MNSKATDYQFNTGIIEQESYTSRDISDAQRARKKKRDEETQAAKIRKERRRKVTRQRRLVLAVIIVAVVGFLALVGSNVVNLFNLRSVKAEKEAELAQLEQEKDGLSQELEQVNSDEYVEQQARSELHMIRPGETLYVFEDNKEEQ